MLVLTRKKDQRIVIGDGIVITVVDIRGDKARIGVVAPPELIIDREEVSVERRKNPQSFRDRRQTMVMP